MTSDQPSRLCAIVNNLGGPEIQPKDIDWVHDVPAGKHLLEWMSNQSLDELNEDQRDEEPTVLPSLRAIALESEERRIREAIQGTVVLRLPVGSVEGYDLPSTIEKRAKVAEAEVRLLDEEHALLKRRLQHAKTIAEHFEKTAETLRDTVRQLDSDLEESHEHLAELSHNADSTIIKSALVTHHLLDSRLANNKSQKGIHALDTGFGKLSALHSSIVDYLEDGLGRLHAAERGLPSPEEVENEVFRLQHLLGGINRGNGAEIDGPFAEAKYIANLHMLCDRLERNPGATANLEDILDDGGTFNIGMEQTVESAWTSDQNALLAAKEHILDETQELLDDQLLPSLTEFLGTLKLTNEETIEVESLVRALLEELEEIVRDAGDAGIIDYVKPNKDDSKAMAVRESAKEVLQNLRDLRPNDAPPLILLDDEDLKKELRRIDTRLVTLKQEEKTWLRQLQNKLSALSDAHNPLLQTMYSESPLNTSKPFETPSDLTDAELVIRKETEKMTKSIIALQKSFELNSRVQRKLNAFVDKWGTT
ncbi:hypothetical protein QCA50_005246 [Cerrena zonata]|uniref:Uncharacterized protein n=1 Tax=Cerrena zonata TaxID=2478898 RepID=A0AAW0GPL4_9APHY